MRLAVAGQIKRGKSTLVNALLREEVAATGQLELTFTVSELCHGDTRAVTVHYKEGGSEGPFPPAALAKYTVRDPAMIDQLRRIRTVEFTMPNELLRSFRLVDTPGLGSVHVTDADNTLAYLGISAAFASEAERGQLEDALAAMGRSGGDIHDDSVRAAAAADAVLYLFSRGIHERDLAAVAEFLGPAGAQVTPLRAFAVLSRADEFWPPGPDLPGDPEPAGYDPMAAAARIAGRYLRDPEVRRLFYTIIPVAGKVGIGAHQLTAEVLSWLDDLAASTGTDARLADALENTWQFATAGQLPHVRLPAAARARLIGLLGGWGTFLACQYRRQGCRPDEVRDRLEAASGVTALRELIVSHFGNRAAVIKLDHGIQDATAAIGQSRLRRQLEGRQAPPEIGVIADRIEQLRLGGHGVAELAVLADHYNGQLALSESEVADLLAITGEFGTTHAARLGLREAATRAQMRAACARLTDTWARREQDPALDAPVREAAHVMVRGYEQIFRALKEPS
jgi:hypothetical protein